MKVRVNKIYQLQPNLMDRIDPCSSRLFENEGKSVRVINKHGCPKANTMGHCYIETLDGEFIGLVSTNSLTDRN